MAILKNITTALGETYSIVGAKTTKADPVPKVWLEFDTIDECTTAGSATVTKYPTEMGVLATDYKYKQPDTVTMVGIISEGGIFGRSSIFSVMGQWDRRSAIEEIRKNLDQLVSNMTLVNIQTRNAGRRTNMTLTAYEINETYDTYGTMQVSMQFQQVPRFDASGALARNASDMDTTDTGIMNTRSILAIGAGVLAAGGLVTGNIAAFD